MSTSSTPSTRPRSTKRLKSPPRGAAKTWDADARTVRRKKHLRTDLTKPIGDGPGPEVRAARRPRRSCRSGSQHRYDCFAHVRDVGAARFLFVHT